MEKLDPETAEIHRQGEEVSNFTKGEAWQIIREKLYRRMNDVASIFAITDKDKVSEIAGRQIAIELILGWFEDIDKDVSNYKDQTSQLIKRPEEDEIITYHEKEDAT